MKAARYNDARREGRRRTSRMIVACRMTSAPEATIGLDATNSPLTWISLVALGSPSSSMYGMLMTTSRIPVVAMSCQTRLSHGVGTVDAHTRGARKYSHNRV